VERDPAGHVADRPEPEHDDAAAVRDAGVLDRLPGGGQDVRQVDEALVRRALGDLDRVVAGVRHAQVLRLSARHLAVQLRIAVERGPHAVLADLGRLALRLEVLLAHEAAPAGDLERHHHPVAGRQVRDGAADLLDDPHGLVSEDVAFAHERA
jgi:hypothetical protein